MERMSRAGLSRTLVLVLVISVVATSWSLAGCTPKEEVVDPMTVLPELAEQIQDAAEAIDEAAIGWYRVDDGFDAGQISLVGREVARAVDDARSVITSAHADIDTLEPSAMTTASLDAVAELEELANTAEAAFGDLEDNAELTGMTASLRGASNLGWDELEDFTEHCNDEDWDDADELIDAAEEWWLEGQEDAEAHDTEKPNCGFAKCAAYFDLHIDYVAECRQLVDYGRNINRYSRTSVNRYNNQIKAADGVRDKILDFELFDSWDDDWYFFADVEDGVRDVEFGALACERAVEELEELLAAPTE